MADAEPERVARRGVPVLRYLLWLLVIGLVVATEVSGPRLSDPAARALLLHDADGAETALNRSLRAHGDNPGELLRAGAMLLDAGYPQRAVGYLTRALEKEPRSPARLTLGLAYEQMGRDSDAEEAYRQAVEMSPTDPGGLNALGYFYAQRGRRLGEAVDLLRRALELSPMDPALLDSLGWALYQKGDAFSALSPLFAAVRMLPDSAEVRFHLGVALARCDERRAGRQWRDRALVELGKAVVLDPKMPDARGILQGVRAGLLPPLPVPWRQFRK